VKAFRDGTCNTLLSTCIGEEGLDVGEVDLIVCFDIANKSPIRMIQRMGRTGRKKEGRIVVLVTEGREQQTLKDCLVYKSNLGSFVTSTQQLDEGKYRDNPKMIPSYIQPKCQKMFITVKKPAVTKNSNLKDLLKNMASENLKFDDFEIVEIKERISDKCEDLWIKENPLECESEPPKINFSKHLEKQRSFQSSGTVKQSKQTEILVGLLQFADSKRYNIPVTQKFSAVGDFNQNKYLKQGDIRSMFSKPAPNTLSQGVSESHIHCFMQRNVL
jgi:superfamily II DNA/RNA helicase